MAPSNATQPREKWIRREAVFAYLLLGLAIPLLNALLALVLGLPRPFIHDEFSYLFMANTFALGRVVNPEHTLAQFFQTFYIIQHNGIYVSKYFPGLGLQLLMGKLLGHAIIGVWLTVGAFGASLLFFLRKFFPPPVALIVSVIFSLQFMVLSYFGHSYWGGSLVALGGIWSLGGAVLAVRQQQARYAWISAAGMIICMLTRPFESFFYLLPLAGWQLYSLLRRSDGSGWNWNCRLLAPMGSGVCLGVLILGLYNQRITGSWSRFPYTMYGRLYAPYGVLFLGEHASKSANDSFFQSLPEPFRQMQDRYASERQERIAHFFRVKLEAAGDIISFLFPWTVAWMFIAAFVPQAHWKDKLWQLCLLTLAMRLAPLVLSWSSTLPHYSANWIFPIAMLCAYGLQWLLSGKFTRLLATIGSVACVSWLAGIYFLSFDPNVTLTWKNLTSYQNRQMDAKWVVETYLDGLTKEDLVFVKYGPGHIVDSEWVYNSPKIDSQKIVWAHDLGGEQDRQLIDYYPQRDIWRVVVGRSRGITLEHWNQSDHKFEFARQLDEKSRLAKPSHD